MHAVIGWPEDQREVNLVLVGIKKDENSTFACAGIGFESQSKPGGSLHHLVGRLTR
ncbi:hypothetical protein D3C87_1850720 [compost metagenome]